MARPSRPGKSYFGIDFDEEDLVALKQIAKEDGDRGVASLVRAIVSGWLRAREKKLESEIVANQHTVSTSGPFFDHLEKDAAKRLRNEEAHHIRSKVTGKDVKKDAVKGSLIDDVSKLNRQ